MQGLVLSDIHGKVAAVKSIVQHMPSSLDFAIILGDLSNLGNISPEKVVEAIGVSKCYAIPGNMDYWETLEKMEKIGISIHGKLVKLGKFNLAGFGGGLYNGPGRVLYPEEKISENLTKLLEQAEKVLLATHLPPKNTALDLANCGLHVGSTAIKAAIEKFQPSMHLCGHVHEAMGETKIGKVPCVNVGPAKEGNALLLELGEKISFQRIEAEK